MYVLLSLIFSHSFTLAVEDIGVRGDDGAGADEDGPAGDVIPDDYI